MNQQFIRALLKERNIQVPDEHLPMLEAQMTAIENMRAALEHAPEPDADIGIVHALKEQVHD